MPLSTDALDAEDYALLLRTQAEANAEKGPRTVPARVLPVPADVDESTATLVATPYNQALIGLDPQSAQDWRDVVRETARSMEPGLADARRRLGVRIEAATVGEVPAYQLEPEVLPDAHRDQLVLHLHGGGFVFGTGVAGTHEAMLVAAYGGYRVLSLDYRMPPDHPFPAALDDAVDAWRALVRDHDPARIAVEGTSAGGGILLALMLRIKEEGLPMPGAIAPGSPCSDCTETGDSYRTNEWVDNMLVSYRAYLKRVVALYANGHDLRDPLISPNYGDFSGLPPAILTTGTRDLLLSNTVRTHRKLRRAGVPAALHVHEGLSHAQWNFDYFSPVTREIYEEVARFFDRHLKR